MQPVSADPTPHLSLAITAFNEAERLPPTLARALEFLHAQESSFEVVINDDGSQDDTAAVAERIGLDWPGIVRVLRAPRNEGKGAGLRRAILATRGNRVLFSDADFSTPIEELPRLMQAIDGGAHVVIGSRVQPDGSDMRRSQPLYRRLFGKVYRVLRDAVTVRGIVDTQSGFKLFVGDVARELFADSVVRNIVFDVEVLYLAQRRGYHVAEVPVQWTNAGGSRMRVTLGHAMRVFVDTVRVPLIHRHETPRVVHPSAPSVPR
jgi:dolichyl-phosphate beta-glucosyltransferase